MTCGTPSFVTSIVVRMLMSICSPMQIVTVPQFCMPVSFKEVSFSSSMTNA